MPSYQEYKPDLDLSNYIKCIWVLEEVHPSNGSDEYVTPDSYVELIFNLGDECSLDQTVMPRVFLVGLQRQPLLFRAYGLTRIIGARFYLWGAPSLLGVRGSGLVDLAKDWEDLADELAYALKTSGFPRTVKRLSDALIERIPRSTRVDPSQVPLAGHMLYSAANQLSIAELAYKCGLTSRQLQRQFSHELGISPKTLARTIRFEQISNRLFANPSLRLLDLTYEYGYTDQAHFVRDFKSFALKTPREFARLASHLVLEPH